MFAEPSANMSEFEFWQRVSSFIILKIKPFNYEKDFKCRLGAP